MKCDLCENDYPPEMMFPQENGDNVCKLCLQGLDSETKEIKPEKKENNGLIQTNFGSSIRKLFDNN